ncbi:MAG: tetratricopeptide repeat protein, partial [Pseudomonadota bacterium]|nr:tetratricopeptide repeat protein [Pseudomonadota bacterium]
MRKWLVSIPMILLAGCQSGSYADARKFLDSLSGPSVPGVEETLLKSAQEAEKQGDWRQAAQIYQQILEKHPDDKPVQLAL